MHPISGEMQITRRATIKCGLGVWMALRASGAASLATVSRDNRNRLDWGAFIDRLDQISATDAHLDGARFVSDAVSIGTQLNLKSGSLAQALRSMESRRTASGADFLLAQAAQRIRFEVILISLGKGCAIPLHDHPRRCGVTVCASGAAQVTNYDIEKSQEGTLLMPVCASTLRPSVGVGFTDRVGNVHRLQALEPTEFIDIFTPPPGGSTGFHWFRTEPARKGSEKGALRVTAIERA